MAKINKQMQCREYDTNGQPRYRRITENLKWKKNWILLAGVLIDRFRLLIAINIIMKKTMMRWWWTWHSSHPTLGRSSRAIEVAFNPIRDLWTLLKFKLGRLGGLGCLFTMGRRPGGALRARGSGFGIGGFILQRSDGFLKMWWFGVGFGLNDIPTGGDLLAKQTKSDAIEYSECLRSYGTFGIMYMCSSVFCRA